MHKTDAGFGSGRNSIAEWPTCRLDQMNQTPSEDESKKKPAQNFGYQVRRYIARSIDDAAALV
ncbi:MAG: hypothetical protein Q9181_006839 [Wetmoreana brouardii]